MSNQPSVQMRVDIGGSDGIPHFLIVVIGPDGVEKGYRFASLEERSLTVDEWICDDPDHEYSELIGIIPFTDCGCANDEVWREAV